MGITTAIILRNYKNRLGLSRLYLRITINRKPHYLRLDKSIEPSWWNGTTVKRTAPDAENINLYLRQEQRKVEDMITLMQLHKKEISFASLNQALKGINPSAAVDFYQFVSKLMEQKKGKISQGSYDVYNDQISKLKKYRPSLRLEEINYNFLLEYESHMRNTLKNEPGGIANTMVWLRMVINAVRKDSMLKHLIKEYPFESYEIPKGKKQKPSMNKEELRKLEVLLLQDDLPISHRRVLVMFLFGCYTGLRFSDIEALTYADIEGRFLKKQMRKTKNSTGTVVKIGLIEKAMALIDKNRKEGKIFTSYSGGQCSNLLKEIFQKAGINKHYTFHTSRHTNITLLLKSGTDDITTSKLAGHSDVNMTKQYADLDDELVLDAMNKLENYLQ